jgi:hypothetical protein
MPHVGIPAPTQVETLTRPYLNFNERFSPDVIDAHLSNAATIAALLWSLAVAGAHNGKPPPATPTLTFLARLCTVLCSFTIPDLEELERLQEQYDYQFVKITTFEWWVFAGGAITCALEAFVLLSALWLQYSLFDCHLTDDDDEATLIWLTEVLLS